MIKTVVFDLDDTLFPEQSFAVSGFRAVSNWLEIHYQLNGFLAIARQLFKEGKRGNIFDITLGRLGVMADPSLIQQLLQVYRQHKPEISLYEDAKWVLNYLKSTKQLGLITDGYVTTQQNKVASLGLEQSFNAIVYSDNYGRDKWKPSNVPYLKAMELLGSKGKECVYVGDNPAKDFITAKKLGWQAIQICREGGEYSALCVDESHEADVKISALYELEKIL